MVQKKKIWCKSRTPDLLVQFFLPLLTLTLGTHPRLFAVAVYAINQLAGGSLEVGPGTSLFHHLV